MYPQPGWLKEEIKRVEEEVKDWPDSLGHLLYDKNTQRVASFKTTNKKSKKARKTTA